MGRINSIIKCKLTLLFLGLLISGPSGSTIFAHPHLDTSIYEIGVLAKRSKDRCMEEWGATAEYLNDALPEVSFEIVPLDFDEVMLEAEADEIDFYILNSAEYVMLQHKFGLQRVATMLNRSPTGQALDRFGSVVFSSFEKNPILDWKRLKDAKIGAVSTTSFGGWLIAQHEAYQNGIDLNEDDVYFFDSHDAVVDAVRMGLVEIGIVRTDTLERIAKEGTIQIEDFSIIEPPTTEHPGEEAFTFLHSTALYPEWPIAVTQKTPKNIAKKVEIALLNMRADSEAAIRSNTLGWGIPLDYTAVERCLKAMRAPPFEDYGRVSYREAVRQHWIPFLIFSTLFFVLLVMATLLGSKVTQLRQTRQQLRQALRNETNLKKSAELYLEIASEIIVSLNCEGKITLLNRSGHKLLGYEDQSLIGEDWFDHCIPTKDHKERRNVFKQRILGEVESSQYYDSPIKTKDGEEREIAWYTTIVRDENHAISTILCSGLDVTENRKSERTLRTKTKELERFNHLAVDREIRMIELKQQVNALAAELDQEPPYLHRDLTEVESAGSLVKSND